MPEFAFQDYRPAGSHSLAPCGNGNDPESQHGVRLALYGKPPAHSAAALAKSLPKIRRQRVFQAFSVPGTEELQRLLSIGPEGCIFQDYQRGVQWKQGVVIYMMLYTIILYYTTPIHCTPLPLHPTVMNTQLSTNTARNLTTDP